MQMLTLIIAIVSLILNVWCIAMIKNLYMWKKAAQELFMAMRDNINE